MTDVSHKHLTRVHLSIIKGLKRKYPAYDVQIRKGFHGDTYSIGTLYVERGKQLSEKLAYPGADLKFVLHDFAFYFTRILEATHRLEELLGREGFDSLVDAAKAYKGG